MRWIWTYLRTTGDNFHKVVDGRIYRSATPSVKNIRKWAKDPGINTFVDLRMPSDYSDAKFFNAQCAALREVGIRRISLPCSDRTPLPESTIETFLEIATNPSKYGKVLVACKGGRHRAGAMVAFYRVRVEGKNACAAYEEAKDVGGYYPNGHEVYDLAFRKLLGALLCCLLLAAVPAYGQHPFIRPQQTPEPVLAHNLLYSEGSYSIGPCIDTRSRAEKIAAGCIVELGNGIEHHCAVAHGCLFALDRPAVARDDLRGASDSLAIRDDRFNWVFWAGTIGYSYAAAMDIATTKAALDRGAIELNPVFGRERGHKVLYTANAIATGGVYAIAVYAERKGHRRVARAILFAHTVIRGAAAIWNHSRNR